MKKADIREWALRVVEQINNNQPNEDSLVELKHKWVDKNDYHRVARQLAGHANAARGESILWLIGVNEKKGVVGVEANEKSEWINKVNSHFEGPVPEYVDVNVTDEDRNIFVAILIETTNAPFVILNPHFNDGGKVDSRDKKTGEKVKLYLVQREVPWREGTRTRAATHNDLIKLLMPKTRAPKFEILDHSLTVYTDTSGELAGSIQLFVYPKDTPLHFPFHRCEVSLIIKSEEDEIILLGENFSAQTNSEETIYTTEEHISIKEAGAFKLYFDFNFPKIVSINFIEVEMTYSLSISYDPTLDLERLGIQINQEKIWRRKSINSLYD